MIDCQIFIFVSPRQSHLFTRLELHKGMSLDILMAANWSISKLHNELNEKKFCESIIGLFNKINVSADIGEDDRRFLWVHIIPL